MKQVAVLQDNIVANIIVVADDADPADFGGVLVEHDANIGDTYDAETWASLAADYKYLVGSISVRDQRDALLADTDWTELPGPAATLSEEQKAAYATYRQALRDVPQQEGFPLDVVWPTLE